MDRNVKIFAIISILAVLVSGVLSMLFGGYDARIDTGPTVWVLVVFIFAVIIPLLIVGVTTLFGLFNLFKKEYKKFLIYAGVALVTLAILFLLTLPPLFIK
ncbi:MAG: hypothetical protein A3F26_03020 [Candidatus Ryanbacteria bacterium RIFCSPHIGHO2_12_FULL_47_12b]|uniref:Uncharacterized protein n=1 Tax=Candidatus Ryanbacteria bacterium RIFCSPLOWO2_02_FULL_47_14 TaxID=1802129 RepID=A0A1G2GY70_9BACT|nr:MAG: hypothetical protein UX74_C0001G0073 [Parcubacteria group bacterium GW2011_GWA2_47_10b]OGZ53167.1 MAG: hypothetical protein A3F26_03020 [Candidatus Ryanbacteria bacterium RIFCSPHIGHO2_12_FULL_47_12b]OGZ55133.1 MAG: hypothetical protein A3J04_02695 [Candidatus Ryanbacteria bacterium RIFCSPLOWO2_02_FULL_47_14]